LAKANEATGPIDATTGSERSTITMREPATRSIPRWLFVAGEASWRALALGAVVYFAFEIVAYLHVAIIPLVLGLFIAALLEPLTKQLERVVPRGVAALVALVVALGVFGGGLAFLGLRIAHQVAEARGFVERGWHELIQLIDASPVDMKGGQLGRLVSSFSDALGSQPGGVVSNVANGARAVFLSASEALLTVAFAFFIMRDGRTLFRTWTRRLDGVRAEQVHRTGVSVWSTLGRYLRGLSIVALVNALEKGLVLLLLGIPMVVPIMILTFVGSFIPLAGPILAGAVASLVALAHSGITDALIVVGASLVIQIIEGNVLQPFILGRAMRLEPILILGSVVIGAIVAGLAGAFLAVPLLAAVKGAVLVLRDDAVGESDG
jgi:predicted PurR-regulated permease PerM